MARRSDIDWDAIERDYCTGQFTSRELAAKHGVTHVAINGRAKKHGWTQDLSAQVRQRTNAALISGNLPPPAPGKLPEKPETAMEIAVRSNIEVIRQHRAYISKAHRIVQKLFDCLEVEVDRRDDLIDLIEMFTQEDLDSKGKPDYKRRAELLAALDLEKQSNVVGKLSATIAKLIQTERVAFNIDASDVEKKADFFDEMRASFKQRSVSPDEERNEAVPPAEAPVVGGQALTPDNAATFQ